MLLNLYWQRHRKSLYGGSWGEGWVKNVGHHGWPTMKKFKITLKCLSRKTKFGPENNWWLKTSYLEFIVSDFLVESLKPTKTSKKGHSFYKPPLTQHYKKYTRLQHSQNMFLAGVRKKTFALHHLHSTTYPNKYLEIKCLYILVNLLENICSRDIGSF